MKMTANAHHVESLLSFDRSALTNVLAHAIAAARIIGHLDDLAIGQLADHVDAIVHELTELLGDPRLRAAPNAAEPGKRDSALMLTSGPGGVL